MWTTKKKIMAEQEVAVFVASDGKEFEFRGDCIEHELDLRYETLKDIETSEDAETFAPFNGAENYESHDYFWYRPKTKDEIELLKLEYNIKSGLDDDDIGKWICIEDNGDGDAWATVLDKDIEYVKRLLNILGYDITVTERSK